MNKNIELSKLFKQTLNSICYFKNNLPEIDSLVRAKIINIEEVGIHFHLIEYNTGAFMSFQEASNSKKLFRIKKEFKVNKTYIAKVVNVDYNKKYIDISCRNVFDEEKNTFIKNINLYDKLFTALIKAYIFNLETDKNIQEYLNDTIYKLNIDRTDKYIERYYENNDYLFEKMPNLENYLSKDLIKSQIITYLPLPKYQKNVLLRINSTSIDAKYKIINTIKYINKELNYNLCFEKTPYFRSKTEHLISKSKDKDSDKNKKILQGLIDLYTIDKPGLYIIIESFHIEEV